MAFLSYLKEKTNNLTRMSSFTNRNTAVSPFYLKPYTKPNDECANSFLKSGEQYTLNNENRDPNFLDIIIANMLSRGYQLVSGEEDEYFFTKKENMHILKYRIDKMPKTVYTRTKSLKVFDDHFYLSLSEIYKFNYHYDILQTQEEVFLHKKVEFSQLTKFPWNIIENSYYSNDFSLRSMESLHSHFSSSTYLVFSKDIVETKEDVDRIKDEIAKFISSLNESLLTFTSTTKNSLLFGKSERDWNYVVIESSRLMNNNLFNDELYLCYNPSAELVNFFEFKIMHLFATPTIVRKLLLFIKKEVNKFNLDIKEKLEKTDKMKNVLDDSLTYKFKEKLDNDTFQELKSSITKKNQYFFPYIEDKDSFSVFDRKCFIFIIFTRKKAIVEYNYSFKNYGVNDFNVIWDYFKNIINQFL